MSTTATIVDVWEWLFRQTPLSLKQGKREEESVDSFSEEKETDDDTSSFFWSWWNKVVSTAHDKIPSAIRDTLPSAVGVVGGLVLVLFFVSCYFVGKSCFKRWNKGDEDDDFDMDGSQRQDGQQQRRRLPGPPFSWNGAHVPRMGSFTRGSSKLEAPKMTTAQEHFAQVALGGGKEKRVEQEEEEGECLERDCSPLSLEGPLVQQIEYIVSWNPNASSGGLDSTTPHGPSKKKRQTVGVFASSKYKSIRRKVCIDLATLAITVHLPRTNKKKRSQPTRQPQRQGQPADPELDLSLPTLSPSSSPKKISSASSVQSDSAVVGRRNTSRRDADKEEQSQGEDNDGDDTTTVVSHKSAVSQPLQQYHHLPSYEDQIWNTTRVEFAETPHRSIPISHVSNITAVPPRRGGVLELTLLVPESDSYLSTTSAGGGARRSHPTSPATPLAAAAAVAPSSTPVKKRRFRPLSRGQWFAPSRRRRSLSPRPSSFAELTVPTLRRQEREHQSSSSQDGREGQSEDGDDDEEEDDEKNELETSIRPNDFAALASVGRTGPLTGQLMASLFPTAPSHSASCTTPAGALAKSPLRRMGTFSSIGGVSASISHPGSGAGTEALNFDARRKAKAAAAATVRSLSLTNFIPSLEEVKSDDNDDDSFVVVVNQNEELICRDEENHEFLGDTELARNATAPKQQQQHRPSPLHIPSGVDNKGTLGNRSDPKHRALQRTLSTPSSPKAAPAATAPPPEKKSVVEEYTFTSASDAADFQACCLAVRVVGREIRNMYNALELLHMASDAYDDSEEVVLSSLPREEEGGEGEEEGEKKEQEKDKEEMTKSLPKDETLRPAGVALYDVWSCFSEVPYLCRAMKRWYDHHYNGGSCDTKKAKKKRHRPYLFDDEDDDDEDRGSSFLISSAADATKGSNSESSDSNAQNRHLAFLEEYRSKRILLGRVDFFRLFCPRSLSALLLPTVTPSVMAASTNHREGISKLLSLRKRVAHASLLVRWYVRAIGLAHDDEFVSSKLTRRLTLDTETANVLHDVQARNEYYEPSVAGTRRPAFSLWGFQVIQRSSSPDIVNPNVDPLDFLPPTVVQAVERHAPVDFFFYVFFPQGKSMAMVMAFVRSLPPGTDPEFDGLWESFKQGGRRERQRKFELMIELGGSLSSYAIQSVSSFWTPSSRFPGVNYAPVVTTRHFGGSLLSPSSRRPRNYVAVTAYANPRMFYNNLLFPAGGPLASLNSSIVNVVIALRGQCRALGTIRLVHVHTESVAVEAPPPTSATNAGGQLDSLLSTRQPEEQGDGGEDETDVDALVEILEGITVPCRTSSARKPYPMAVRSPGAVGTTATVTSSMRRSSEQGRVAFDSEAGHGGELTNVPILETISRSDLARFIQASDDDLRVAAVRVVESTAWRGVTFPIDTSVCRVELQSGQFFQQGRDRHGRPIFYFRNMCLGPWRRDADATMLAVLHRLETAMLEEKMTGQQQQQCTLIVCTGRPVVYKVDTSASGDDKAEGEAETASSKKPKKQNLRADVREDPAAFGANPRLDAQEEDFQVHSNYTLLQRLVELVLRHYPECMAQTLVLSPSSNWMKLQLARFVTSVKTRGKVVWLKSVLDLKSYVSSQELVTFCGGDAPVRKDAFEAW